MYAPEVSGIGFAVSLPAVDTCAAVVDLIPGERIVPHRTRAFVWKQGSSTFSLRAGKLYRPRRRRAEEQADILSGFACS